ncbi:MAG: molybdopterin molybdotransferase MoeA [Bacillota bacterium]|nr:molybdopterin molybdotransferase MoeA [Bacillota bacterium]
MDFFNVVSADEAVKLINESVKTDTGYEKVNILDSIGRICCEDIRASVNIPEFKRSSVDGYAVRFKDTFGASEAMPAILNYKGEVLMGKVPPSDISYAECIYVPTGGMLPDSADSVVMIEYTDKLDEDTVLSYSPAAKGDNVINIGDDVKKGDVILKKGQKLRPYEVGVLASLGISQVPVYRKLKAAVISTGDELVPCTENISLGEVRDINTYLLCSLLLKDGVEPVSYGIIRDDYNLLKETVDRASEECDMVLISGGSSVGKKDQTLKVLNSYEDGKVLAHGISIKPGKPTIIGKRKDKLIMGLPGHPLACSVIYQAIVRKFIFCLMNYEEIIYPINAVMKINYHKAKGREEYLPVAVEKSEKGLTASPVFGKSGLISVFSKAYGYIRIEKDIEGLREGESVEVYPL